MKINTTRRRQRRSEICQQGGLTGIELADVLLEFFAVKRIQGQQFFNGCNNCHGIGLHFVAIAMALRLGILDLCNKWALVAEPANDAESPETLRQKLARVIRGPRWAMQSDCTTHGRQLLRLDACWVGFVDKGQPE